MGLDPKILRNFSIFIYFWINLHGLDLKSVEKNVNLKAKYIFSNHLFVCEFP